MHSKINAFASLMMVVALTGCVTVSADGIKHTEYSRNAISGERTKVGTAAHTNPDCTSAGVPTIEVTKKPSHGTLEIVREPVFKTFDGSFAKCSKVKMVGMVGYYTSAKGYVGKDSASIQTSFGDGHISTATVTINVIH